MSYEVVIKKPSYRFGFTDILWLFFFVHIQEFHSGRVNKGDIPTDPIALDIFPLVDPNLSHDTDYIVNIGVRIKAERWLRIGQISVIMESRGETSGIFIRYLHVF